MDLDKVKQAVRAGRVRWRTHALEQMARRRISTDDVRQALLEGEIVEDYPLDSPFPSVLVLGRAGPRSLHVVVAHGLQTAYAYVVTAYEPDLEHFLPDFRTRRKDE